MIGQASSIRHIGLDLSRSSESDTVTKRRPVRAYVCVIYTRIYVIHVYMPSNVSTPITTFSRIELIDQKSASVTCRT